MLGLSNRRVQIARLVTEGCTNREIADRLGVSVHTVKNVVAMLFVQFGARNRTALAVCLAKGHEWERRAGGPGAWSPADESNRPH